MRPTLPPSLTFLAVTALLMLYGHHAWSWIAGPVAGLVVWELDGFSHLPAEPALAHAGVGISTEPVD